MFNRMATAHVQVIQSVKGKVQDFKEAFPIATLMTPLTWHLTVNIQILFSNEGNERNRAKKMTIGAICCFDDTSRHEIKLNMQH